MKKRILSMLLCLIIVATNLTSCGFIDRIFGSNDNEQNNPPPQINTDTNNDNNSSNNTTTDNDNNENSSNKTETDDSNTEAGDTNTETGDTDTETDDTNTETDDKCDKINHSWIFDKTIKTVSCEEDGVLTYVCTCGETKAVIEKSVGHIFGEWEEIKHPTCTELGERRRTCTICSAEENDSISVLNHDYDIKEKTVAGITDKIFDCKNCDEKFVISEELISTALNSENQQLFDCNADFAFFVACEEDETYIYEHLTIIDAYFENTELESSTDVICSYTLEKTEEGIWKVIANENYIPGNTYKAKRSGGVVFKDYAIGDLTFSIFKEETNNVSFNEGIIFLQNLENSNPGYYPYSVEFSEFSDKYWLTLKKSDGLNISDIICVGEKTDLNEILKNSGNNFFGKIVSITEMANGDKLIELSKPSISEIFAELEIYSSTAIEVETIQIEDNVTEQLTAALLSSEDFAKFLSVTYTSTVEYMDSRGLSSSVKTFKEFLESIKIDEDKTEYFHYENDVVKGSITISGNISIPVTLSDSTVGSVDVKFEAYINLKLKPNLLFEEGEYTKFDFRIDQDTTVGFSFNVDTKVDYSAQSKPYVWNTQTGVYHYKNCKHIAQIKDETIIKKITAEELFSKIEDTNLATIECQTCKPIAAMKSSMYMINSSSKVFHTCYCKSDNLISEANRIFTEKSAKTLISENYTPCNNCHPEQITLNNFEEKLLEKIKYEDFGVHIEEAQDFAKGIQSQSESHNILICNVPFTFYVGSVDISFYAYIDFKLEASLSYEIEINNTAYYGVRINGFKLETYDNNGGITKCNKHELDLTGKTRLDIGLLSEIELTILGKDKFSLANASLNLKTGLYAKVQGTMHLDFASSNNSYSAAYFESGLHCDVIIGASVVGFELLDNKSVLDKNDFPLWKLGYEKVYYNFENPSPEINIGSIYNNLLKSGVLKVKYFDLLEMTEKTESLNLSSDNYSVILTLENGTHCYIQNGYIVVNSDVDNFTDILKIQVIGNNTWGNFKTGNCKIMLPECSVTINFKRDEASNEEGQLEYIISEDGNSYFVTGIGDYKGSDVIIPSIYNEKPVGYIAPNAFKDNKEITSVTIPNTITIIEESAFENCSNLANVTFEDNSWLQFIGDSAFANCSNLYTMHIPARVSSIGDDAFYGCYSVVSFGVDSDNTAYQSRNGILYSGDGKTLLQFPANHPSEEIIIPYGVEIVGEFAFANSLNLKKITFSNSLTTIGNFAFMGCDNLEAVTFPKNLESVGVMAFDSCEKLENIYYKGSEEDWYNTFIDSGNEDLLDAVVYYISDINYDDPENWNLIGAYYDYTNEYFVLTDDVTWSAGIMWCDYNFYSDFTFEMEYYTGNRSSGADGIAVAFYTDTSTNLPDGEYLGFVGGKGYGVELDTYYNYDDPYDNHIGLIQGNTHNHLTTASLPESEDGMWHTLTIDVTDNLCSVYVDGNLKFTYVIEYAGSGCFGISAATGSCRNLHAIRNINVIEKYK